MESPQAHLLNRILNRFRYHAAVSRRTSRLWFIPHEENAHHPYVLRDHMLRWYSIALIVVKIVSTGFLYILFPTPAKLATITSSTIISLTNNERQKNGLSTLSENSQLRQAALNKANDMVANNYFAHTSPDGTTPWDWIKGAGYVYTYAGENLAKDFVTAESVHNAWMASPSHRNNILNGNYAEIGVGVVEGEISGSDTIVLVQYFGTRYVAPAEPEPTPEPSPTPAPSPSPQPNPAPAPAPPPPPTPDDFRAELISRSYEQINIESGKGITVEVVYRNTGSATWAANGQYFLALNTYDPAGRESPFRHTSWSEKPFRTTRMDTDRVAPGETGLFRFALQSPTNPGAYVETFALVAEGLTYIPDTAFSIPITVVVPVRGAADVKEAIEENDKAEGPVEERNVEETTTVDSALTKPSVGIVERPAQQPLSPEDISSTSVEATIDQNSSSTIVESILKFTQRFYQVFLIFIIVALLGNILIRIRVQHPHVILRSLLVIALATVLVASDLHFIERLGELAIR